MYDTLSLVQELERLGINRKHAEGYIHSVMKMIDSNFATKSDLKDTEVALRSDLQTMEVALRSDMQSMESGIRADLHKMESGLRTDIQRIEYEMKALESRLTLKLGGIISVSIGIAVALTKLVS